jgi:hypothetical protein
LLRCTNFLFGDNRKAFVNGPFTAFSDAPPRVQKTKNALGGTAFAL